MGQSCQDNPTLPTGWEVNIGGGYKEVKQGGWREVTQEGGYKEVKGLDITEESRGRLKQRRVEGGLNREGLREV